MENIFWYFVRFVLLMRCAVSIPIDRDYQIEWLVERDGKYEYGELFEGDMDLNENQLADVFGERNASIGENYRWPNATIPYVLSTNYSAEQNAKILKTMKEIENVSCVRFRRRTTEIDYVQFEVCCSVVIFNC